MMTKFAIGTRIITRARAHGHTRLPGYLAQRPGVVDAYLGTYVLPDAYVRNPGTREQSELYTIAFDARALFDDADAGTVRADLFAEYFEEER